jgi:hypothetical protein
VSVSCWRLFICFSSFFSFSSRENTSLSSFIWICQFQSFCFLLIIVVLDHVIKVLVIFNLVLELQFVIFFQFSTYLFDFWFFFLGSFVKVLLVFNSILQSKFMFFTVFNLAFIILIYFPFC